MSVIYWAAEHAWIGGLIAWFYIAIEMENHAARERLRRQREQEALEFAKEARAAAERRYPQPGSMSGPQR